MTVTASGRSLALGGVVAILGGILAVAGALLPWESIDPSAAARAGTASAPIGLEFNDGKIFVFVASLAIIASATRLFGSRLPSGVADTTVRLIGSGAGVSAIAGAMVATFAVLNLKDIGHAVDLWNSAAAGSASVGIGLFLDLAGGFAMMAGGGIGLFFGRQ